MPTTPGRSSGMRVRSSSAGSWASIAPPGTETHSLMCPDMSGPAVVDVLVPTVDGIADDWPIGYADLQPYYAATDRDFGVSGLGGNPRYPAGEDPPLPPLPIGPLGLRVARAHAKLGWHWWPLPNAILS